MDSPSPKKGSSTEQEENHEKFLKELEKQITSLKESALEQGLKQSDVKDCVKDALSRSLGDTAKVKWSRWKKFAVVSVVVALTLVMLPTLTDLALTSRPGMLVQDVIMKHYMTSVLMFVRRHTFFLHRYRISNLYAEECVIYNPVYQTPSPGCHVCRRVHTIKTVPLDYRVRRNHLGFPLIYKERMERAVALEGLADMVGGRREELEGDRTSTFDSSLPWVRSALDLADPDVISRLANTSDFKLAWAVNNLLVGQLFRKKFPRHSSLPPEMEVTLDKKLIIQGWDSPPLSLAGISERAGGVALYMQGSGMRKLVLTPHKSCSQRCIPVSVLVNQTDFVTWPADTFAGTLYQAGSNVSVAMLTFLL